MNGNSGAIIIAIGLIVGFNFERLINVVSFALYNPSGKVAPDETVREALRKPAERRRTVDQRVLAEAAEEKAWERTAEDAEMVTDTERARDSHVAKRKAILNAWEAFLTANRSKFKEIEVVKNALEGDFSCLRRVEKLHRIHGKLSDSERQTIEHQFIIESYKILDEAADAFIIWLNNSKTLGRSNWTYGDLKDRPFGSIYINQLYKESFCLPPQEVWRANRFEKRID